MRALAWERLDEEGDTLVLDVSGLGDINTRPANAIIISPSTYRSLSTVDHAPTELFLYPTSFGAREPTLPIARTITIARIATAEGVDKRYEESWTEGLRMTFASDTLGPRDNRNTMRMVKRGDIITCPTWKGSSVSDDETSESLHGFHRLDRSIHKARGKPDRLAYFLVTGLSYEPLNSLEDDFRSNLSSKARAGELGCWVDGRVNGQTRIVMTGVERGRIPRRRFDKINLSIREQASTGLLKQDIDSQRLRINLSMSPRPPSYATSWPHVLPMRDSLEFYSSPC